MKIVFLFEKKIFNGYKVIIGILMIFVYDVKEFSINILVVVLVLCIGLWGCWDISLGFVCYWFIEGSFWG